MATKERIIYDEHRLLLIFGIEHKSAFDNVIDDLRKIKINHISTLLKSQQNI